MEVNKLLDYINKQRENDRFAHVFLLETNDIDKCYKDTLEVIKSINCPHNFLKDCKEECNLCYLIDNESLPSVVKISPDGASIKKEQVRELKEKLSCKPVYSKYNTYIILEADKLNPQAANTMLKFLEEPEEHIVGFLITKNQEQVLTTIKSRCQAFKLLYQSDEEINENIANVAKKYLDSMINQEGLIVNKRDVLGVLPNREDILHLLMAMFDMVKNDVKGMDMLEELSKLDAKTKIKLMELLENFLQKVKYNVNLEMLLDSLYIEVGRLIHG